MKKIIILLVLFYFSMILGFSQAGGNAIYEQNNRYLQNQSYNESTGEGYNFDQRKEFSNLTISNNYVEFEVNAIKNIRAKSFLAIFNLIQIAPTASAADSLLNLRFNRFKTGLTRQEIKTEQVFVDMVSLVPLYEYEVQKKLFSTTYNEVPAGFELQKNIHVQFTESQQLDDILTLAAKNEIYDLVKVEYYTDSTDLHYNELRKKSIQYMRAKIDDYKQLGLNLDEYYHTILESRTVDYPVDRYRSYQAFSGSSLEAARKANVTTVRKPKSMFYNKRSYHNYDIIINPEIIEPVIQFSYHLKIRYTTKEPAKVSKEFYIINTDGEYRKFDYNK